jgi:hypothetical protein
VTSNNSAAFAGTVAEHAHALTLDDHFTSSTKHSFGRFFGIRDLPVRMKG